MQIDEKIKNLVPFYLITAVSCLTIVVTIISLNLGITIVFPHLYYVPIILTSYYYPKKGIPFSIFISVVYLFLIALIADPTYTIWISALTRIVIYVLVAAIVSYVITMLRESKSNLRRKNEDLEASYEELSAIEEELRQNHDELVISQHQLQDKERRLADIIDFLPDATFAIDKEGKVIAWNKSIAKMTGVPSSEILGKSDYEYAIPFHKKRRPTLINLVLNEELKNEVNYTNLDRDGDRFFSEIFLNNLNEGKGAYLWFTASPLYDTVGNVVGAIESIRDITDRKEAEEEIRRKNEDLEASYEELSAIEEELRQNHDELVISQHQLQEKERRLADIIDFLPDATFAIDKESKVIAWNKAIEKMTGISSSEVFGKGDYEYALHLYGKRRPLLVDVVLNNKLEREIEYPVFREGDNCVAEIFTKRFGKEKGAYLWFTASPLYDTVGNVVGAIESIRDITDRKEAEEEIRRKNEDLEASYEELSAIEEELRQNLDELVLSQHQLHDKERRLADIIDFLPDATFAIDKEGKVIAWNKSIEKITGITSSEILGKNNFEYSLPVYGERRPLLIDLVLNEKLRNEVEYPVLDRDGDKLIAENFSKCLKGGENQTYLWFTASPLYDTVGNVVGAIESIRDITDRKEAEEEIRRKNEDLEASYEQLSAIEEELRQNLDELVLSQHQLHDKERRLADIIDFLPDATFAIDKEGKVIAWNKSIAKMTGVPSSEILGKDNFEYSLPIYGERRPLLIDLVLNEKLRNEVEYPVLDQDGDKLIAENFSKCLNEGAGGYLWFTASPLYDTVGNVVGAIESIRDITDRKEAEENILKSLKEKDILLKEVHHRVKNNMQVISSLLNLQSGYSSNLETHNVLIECNNRVKSMALVHENLYKSNGFAEINARDYIMALAYEIAGSYNIYASIDLNLEIDKLELDIDTAITCGLIINELVSNSFKHAFVEGNKGTISIEMHENEGNYSLIVSDDGIGFPKDLDFQTSETLGLELTNILTKQLNGQIFLERENGTKFTILFSKRWRNS